MHRPPGTTPIPLTCGPSSPCSELGSDKLGMAPQLNEAYPMSTYPHAIVTPDGGLAVAAKSSLVKYNRLGDGTTQGTRFQKAWSWPDRPGAAWVYPQVRGGQGRGY